MSGTKLCFVGKCHELHTQYKRAHLGTALKSNPFSVKSNLSSVRSKHCCVASQLLVYLQPTRCLGSVRSRKGLDSV
uniref:Uncharacterized protein n=1 Tax=Accipiter nisus TaxID=211598 RepID=A0A8B9N4G4_9AVES